MQDSPLTSFAPKFFNGIGTDTADILDMKMMFRSQVNRRMEVEVLPAFTIIYPATPALTASMHESALTKFRRLPPFHVTFVLSFYSFGETNKESTTA